MSGQEWTRRKRAKLLAEAMRAAVNRLFAARIKQRHLLRNARQAIGFVAREG